MISRRYPPKMRTVTDKRRTLSVLMTRGWNGKRAAVGKRRSADSRRIEENEIKRIKGDFYNEIKAISGKVNRLIDMRMEGELSKEEYLEMRGKVEEEKKQAEQRLADFEKQVEDRTNLSVTQEEGQE